MKEVSATLRNLQISPRKVRLVADLIRGASIEEAKTQLAFSHKQAARPMLKLLNSAVANADHNNQLDTSSLRVKTIFVNEGPVLKRYMPRAFGRATTLRKRMSHIKIVVEGQETKAPATKKSEKKKEVSSSAKASKDKKKETGKPQEKTEPKEMMKSKGPAPKDSHKPEPVDPRMQGKQRPSKKLEQHNKKIISS